MQTFLFKGYNYKLVSVNGKAGFDAIFDETLARVNAGKSITKDLENAYQISPGEVYLIRYDQARRALVPVRVVKEAVDGQLIRDRYDSKARVLQQGIGREMSKHSKEVFETVEKKKQLNAHLRQESAAKQAQEEKQLEIDGANFLERLMWHGTALKELQALLENSDELYRRDRDYKGKIDMAFEKIESQVKAFETLIPDIELDQGKTASNVRHLVPSDISRDNPPEGYLQMLQIFQALVSFNTLLEKEWTTLIDYVFDFESLPLKFAQITGRIVELINRTKLLTSSAERILFPAKFSFRRDLNAVYDFKLLSQEVIKILTRQGD